MKFNYDEWVDRSHTNSVKLDRLKTLYGEDDLIPLWVADTDFKSPPAVIEALRKRVEHGVFGYTTPPENYFTSIAKWLKKRHNWIVQPEHINFVPGIVKGIAF